MKHFVDFLGFYLYQFLFMFPFSFRCRSGKWLTGLSSGLKEVMGAMVVPASAAAGTIVVVYLMVSSLWDLHFNVCLTSFCNDIMPSVADSTDVWLWNVTPFFILLFVYILFFSLFVHNLFVAISEMVFVSFWDEKRVKKLVFSSVCHPFLLFRNFK